MSAFNEERVLSVHHWTDDLFSFTTSRDPSFRFENGHFTMVGLMVEGRPLVRAYSIASANYEDTLEFFSIKVAEGPLTSRLRHVEPGSPILVGRKPTGTLLLENLLPGRTLYLLSTGTGLAPFLGLVKDPAIYERYERVVLAHTCRHVSDLAYRQRLTEDLPADPYVGEAVAAKLLYYPTVTREPFEPTGRISDLMRSGRVARALDLPSVDPAEDRMMLCGSPAMLADLTDWAEVQGFVMGNNAAPGTFVIEKAFVER